MNRSSDYQATRCNREHPASEDDLQHVRESLRGLQFGSVNIIVQNGLIVQIDRTEKRRVVDGQRQQR